GALGARELAPALLDLRAAGELGHQAADVLADRLFLALCGAVGGWHQAASSWSQLRMIETASCGFFSASSPTFCTDWACTWPWTLATSIIAEVRFEMATDSSLPTIEILAPPVLVMLPPAPLVIVMPPGTLTVEPAGPAAATPMAPATPAVPAAPATTACPPSGVTMRRTSGRTTVNSTIRPSRIMTPISA